MRTASLVMAAVGSGMGLATARGEPAGGNETMALPGGGSTGMKPDAEPLHGAAPLQQIDAHLCGLHFYCGDLRRQAIAHHYCSHVGNHVRQCVIYDSDKKDARLVGIEYIIDTPLFERLSVDEKKLWHSHVYEVKSGLLTAPGMSADSERELMRDFVGTYGKTWYTWQVDRDDTVPLGIPQLMMAFVADGEVNPELLARRDKEFGKISEETKKSRAAIAAPVIQPGADAWKHGEAIQLVTTTLPMSDSP